MPLKLNVGLSRKVADQHYGSRGASVNVELELESGLVTEPTKLQERIRQLFTLVRASVNEELNGNGHAPPSSNGNGNGHTPTNGNGNGNGTPRNGQRQATQSQVKAINSIARNRRIDIAHFLNDRFHVNKPEDLSIKDASKVIDELKADSTEGRQT